VCGYDYGLSGFRVGFQIPESRVPFPTKLTNFTT
jgi:hypothetical protein